jgi:hypothetical protein
VAGTCECGKELSGSIKSGNLLTSSKPYSGILLPSQNTTFNNKKYDKSSELTFGKMFRL